MTGPAGSTITRRGRFYIDAATGDKYPSVTTVISTALAKPALTKWYARMAAERAVENAAELSRRVRLEGPEEAAKWVAAAPQDAARTAALKGSDLHDLAQRHADGKVMPDDLDPDAAAMLRQYETFLADFTPTILQTEMTVLNRAFGYGGTADAIMELPGRGYGLPLVVDYKTGRTGPYSDWAIQLAAYAHGERMLEKTPKGIIESDIPCAIDPDRGLILRIRPEKYELYETDLTASYGVFQAMLRIFAFTSIEPPFTRIPAPHDDPLTWLARIDAVGDVAELYEIWRSGTARNVWTDELSAACAQRKKLLTES